MRDTEYIERLKCTRF